MIRFTGPVLSLCAALSVGACAHAPNRPLTQPRPESVKTTQVVAVVGQDQIYAATIDRGDGGVAQMGATAGLIGALVAVAARPDTPKDTVKFDPAAAPMLNLAGELESAIKVSDAPAWFGSRAVTTSSSSDEAVLNGLLQQSSADATLFVFGDYHLSPTLRSLVVTAVPALYLRGQRFTKNLKGAAYYNTVTVEVTGLTDWAGNQDEQLKRALKFANGAVADLVFADVTALVAGQKRMALFKEYQVGKAYRVTSGALRLSVDIDNTPAIAAPP